MSSVLLWLGPMALLYVLGLLSGTVLLCIAVLLAAFAYLAVDVVAVLYGANNGELSQ